MKYLVVRSSFMLLTVAAITAASDVDSSTTKVGPPQMPRHGEMSERGVDGSVCFNVLDEKSCHDAGPCSWCTLAIPYQY
jgi:hypothetical protein